MRALGALALAACAASPSSQHVAKPPVQRPHVPLRPAYIPFVDPAQLVPRPRIAMASIAAATDRARLWPLTELPSLQPHHDFAMAHDLCTPAWAQRNKARADLVAYGAAWCRYQAGDLEAVVTLAALAVTAQSDVQHAARLDVINLLSIHDADLALGRLREFKLDAPDNLDLLAATYDALGMHEQAMSVAERVWRIDTNVTPVERCERVLAWSVLDENTPERMAEMPNALAGACAKRAAATICAIDAASLPRLDSTSTSTLAVVRECYNEFSDDENAEHRAWLVIAFYRWRLTRMPAEWVELSREADQAMPVPGAEDLAISALENALHASSCEPGILRTVAAAAYRIANLDTHQGQYDSRLDSLRAMTDARCVELHE